MVRRLGVVATMLYGLFVLTVMTAPPAAAHADLVSSDPADGTRLDTVPHRVTLTFSEPVSLGGGHLTVADQRGREVESGEPDHPDGDRSGLTVELRDGLGEGSYLVSYAIVSADAHPVTGATAFVVGSGPLITASGAVGDASGTDPVVNGAFAATRWVSYAGVALLGGLVFVLTCWPGGRGVPRVRSLVRAGCCLAAGGAAASLLLQGPYVAGEGVTGLFTLEPLRATLSLPYGRLLLLRLAAVGVLAVVSARLLRAGDRPRSTEENIALGAGFALLLSFAASGHAITSGTPTLAVFVDIAHLAAMSVWLGGLVVLLGCLLPSGRDGDLAAALPRFSRIAIGAITTLVATGSYQVLREVSSVRALWSTGYGQVVSLKILGVVTLLAVANLSRLAVRRRYRVPVAVAAGSGSPPSPLPEEPVGGGDVRSRLRVSVRIEVGIAVAVLALASLLVAQAPPRSTGPRPYVATVEVGDHEVRLTITPDRAGPNTVRAEVRDGDGTLVDPRGIDLSARYGEQGDGPLRIQFTRTDTGRYEATDVTLPRAGTWALTVQLRTSTFDEDTAELSARVR